MLIFGETIIHCHHAVQKSHMKDQRALEAQTLILQDFEPTLTAVVFYLSEKSKNDM